MAGCNIFTVAALCSQASSRCVHDVWTKAVQNVMFIATKLTNNCGMYSSFQSTTFVLKFGKINM